MISIKIRCTCGQKFAFDVEPVGGRMPGPVTCPVCGRTATEAGNEQIRLQLAPSAPPVPPKKSKTLLIVGVCVGALVLLGLTAVGLLWLKFGNRTTSRWEVTASEPSAQTDPATTVDKPAQVKRDPSFIGVGALFDRDSKTREVQITRVLAHSPAQKAGIVAGDVIIGVDDTPVEPLRLKEIVDMVMGPPGSNITMVVISSETGKTNRLEMVRKKFHR